MCNDVVNNWPVAGVDIQQDPDKVENTKEPVAKQYTSSHCLDYDRVLSEEENIYHDENRAQENSGEHESSHPEEHGECLPSPMSWDGEGWEVNTKYLHISVGVN